jgi:hypothetical protein
MTTSLLQPPLPLPLEERRTGRRPDPEGRRPHPEGRQPLPAGSQPHPAGRRPATLEARLEEVLREAQGTGAAECPVCHAGMRRQGAAARCGSCGSVVS